MSEKPPHPSATIAAALSEWKWPERWPLLVSQAEFDALLRANGIEPKPKPKAFHPAIRKLIGAHA